MPLPLTRTKLSQSLALIAYHQSDEGGLPFPTQAPSTTNVLDTTASVVDSLASLKFIGSTYEFRVTQDRSNYRRRGINSSIEAFGVTPGQVTTKIELSKAALYSEDAMAAFSFLPGNIAFQTRPIVILELALSPDAPTTARDIIQKSRTAAGLLELTSILLSPSYINCWMSDKSVEYKLESDQMVVESITFDVAKVNSLVAPPIIGDAVSVLAQAVPLVSRAANIIK